MFRLHSLRARVALYFAAFGALLSVVMAVFGIVGYLFERFRFPITPLVLGVILGPLAETSFMTTMVSFNNDWTVFFKRPVSGILMTMACIALVYPVARHRLQRRRLHKREQ